VVNNMDDDIVKLLRDQEKILGEMRNYVHRWMDDLLRDAFNPESFLRYAASLGIDLSQIPKMVGQAGGIDPYEVLGLDRSASDDQIKKRYRELLHKLHPDTSGTEGTTWFFQMVLAAYEKIRKERGWQ